MASLNSKEMCETPDRMTRMYLNTWRIIAKRTIFSFTIFPRSSAKCSNDYASYSYLDVNKVVTFQVKFVLDPSALLVCCNSIYFTLGK